jgi:hypothetical protein
MKRIYITEAGIGSWKFPPGSFQFLNFQLAKQLEASAKLIQSISQ